MDRAEVVHLNFLEKLSTNDLPKRLSTVSLAQSGLSKSKLMEIFESQILSRQLDRTSRKMQARGEGFYTIGSSGHEGNAAISAAFRVDDMAFLHYRDAAFFIQRSKLLSGQTPTWDMLLSFSASADDPISGGRHKVLGSKALFIPPQTSTIASHLPKAVGAAYSIGLSRRHRPDNMQMRHDSVVLASFGDASANHSTSQGAFNSACWSAYQNIPMPLVFICEDNGIGISTKTPGGWIEAGFSQRPALNYMRCNGLDILDTYKVAREAEYQVRKHRKPIFLHMNCVRLYGHAGSDVQTAYISRQEVEAAEANDPLLHSANIVISEGILTADEVLNLYQKIGERVERVAIEAALRPKLVSAAQVMAAIIPPKLAPMKKCGIEDAQREKLFASDWKALQKPAHTARLISWAITDLMAEHQNIILAGEDIGPKGGVYNVTGKVHARFGSDRVINTLLDEQSILGLAIGLAHNGFLPIPEIQFLAYLHNAEDQLRGEAATLSFFSDGQYTNPMIIRIAGLGYQKGFGGHFHNDNSIAVLRDIPGLIIACPSNGADAVLMLRECVRLALEEQRIIVIIEPIALYMTRDLHAAEDGLWLAQYPHPQPATDPGEAGGISLGQIGQYQQGTDLAIVSYGNGYYLSRQAEKILADTHNINIRVIDLRWLAPINEELLLSAVNECENILVVDECRETGSQSEALISLFAQKAEHRGKKPKLASITALDSFIPLGKAATVTLPSCDSIVAAALALLNSSDREL